MFPEILIDHKHCVAVGHRANRDEQALEIRSLQNFVAKVYAGNYPDLRVIFGDLYFRRERDGSCSLVQKFVTTHLYGTEE